VVRDGTIGDYRVLGILGAGGMGEVFRVEHTITRRVEALKILHGQAGRLLREIRLQASLNHPNIVPVHNAFAAGDDLVMVMELVEGEPLDRVLEHGRLPWRQAVGYARQALAALGYAHARGITHRDVKPANLLLTPEGVVKLTDFGLAKSPADPRLSGSGEILGSAYYMAPEQVRGGEAADPRSDIYALGVVLYEMVAGRRPFDGDGAFAVMRAQVEEIPPSPSCHEPGLPRALNDTILRALEKRPEDRFASAEEFEKALEQVGHGEVRGEKRGRIELAAAAALALALLAGIWLEGRKPPTPVVMPTAPRLSPAKQPAPPPTRRTVTLPAGTLLQVRTRVTLSSNTHQAGEKFTGVLEAPLQARGWIVAGKGALVEGVIVEADRGGRLRGRGWLSVKLTGVHSAGAGLLRLESDPIAREGGRGRVPLLRRGSPAVIPADEALEFHLKYALRGSGTAARVNQE
jgi:hypothetical protein